MYCLAYQLSCFIFFLGVFVGNVGQNREDEASFLTERYCLDDLLEGLKSPCPCGISHNAWQLNSVVQVRLDPSHFYEPLSLCSHYCRRAMC